MTGAAISSTRARHVRWARPSARRSAPKPARRDRTACPACGGARFWHAAARDAAPELLCARRVAFTVARDVALDAPAHGVSDLPPRLQLARRSFQDVYRIVRDHDGRTKLARFGVWAEYRRRVDPWAGVSTVAHALTFLRAAGLARRGALGWAAVEPEGGA